MHTGPAVSRCKQTRFYSVAPLKPARYNIRAFCPRLRTPFLHVLNMAFSSHPWPRLLFVSVFLFSASPALAQLTAEDEPGAVALAEQLLDRRQPWEARDLLERERVRNPNDPRIRKLLGKAYGQLALQAMDKRNATEALTYAEQALAIVPNQIELVYTRALAHELLSDYDRAIEGYEQTVALEAGYKDASVRVVHLYKRRGRDHLQKGDLAASERDYAAILRFVPGDTEANYFLGYLTLKTRRYDLSKKYLLVSTEDPDYHRISQLYLGMGAAETRDWTETVRWMEEARKDESLRAQSDPYLLTAYYNLGVQAMGEARHDDADRLFNDVLRLDANFKDAHFNLGMVWDAKGDLPKAKGYYEKVRSLQRGHRQVEIALADVDYRIAVGLYEKGVLEKAQALLREAIALDAQPGNPYYYMGMIHRRFQDDDQALPFFEAAIQKAAFVLASSFEAGEINFGRKDWPNTIRYMDSVRAQDGVYRADKVTSYLREAWWQLAMADIRERRWADAEKKLREVLKHPPDLPPTHYYIGLAALRQNHLDTAVEELESAFSKQPRDADTRTHLSEARQKRGQNAFDAGRFADAEPDLRRAVEIVPGNRDAAYTLALTEFQLKKYPVSIQRLEKLAGEKPPFRDSVDHLALAYGTHGEQLLDEKKKPQARALFQKALKLNPVQKGALYGMGLIAFEERRYAEAARNLQQVHDRDPGYRRAYAVLIDAYWNLGYIAFNAKKKDRAAAEENFKKVIGLDPNHAQALYHLADLAADDKSYALAKRYFERVIALKQLLREAHYGLGAVLYEEKDFGNAADEFDAAYRLDANFKNVGSYLRRSLRNHADDLFTQGRGGDAVPYYERFLVLEPRDLGVHLRLGEIAERAGFVELAIGWYEKSIPLMRKGVEEHRYRIAMLAYRNEMYDKALEHVKMLKAPEARELTGTIHLAMGKRDRKLARNEDARRHLEAALKVIPKNIEVLSEYGLLLVTLEEYEKAIVPLRKAVDTDPNVAGGQKLVAEVYRKIGARAMAAGRLKDADAAYKNSQQYDPSNEAEFTIGVLAFKRKELRTALQHFEVVESDNPKYPELRTYVKDTVCALGDQAYTADRGDEALPYLTRCAELDSGDRQRQYQIGMILYRKGDFEGARERFRDTMLNAGARFPEAKGNFVAATFTLTQRAFEAGEAARTVSLAEEILRYDSQNHRARILLARALEAQGKLADAETAFRKVMDARPDLTEASDGVRRVMALRKAEAARRAAEEALKQKK